jgi:FkbM family methyltransferase
MLGTRALVLMEANEQSFSDLTVSNKKRSCNIWQLTKFYAGLLTKMGRRAVGRFPHNYLRLQPPCSSRQVLYSFRSKQKLKIEVRDSIDLAVLQQIFFSEDYDVARLTRSAEILRRYSSIVDAGSAPLIVDCGANIGLSAAYFVDVFTKARVIAIEPEGGNLELARRNCAGRNIDLLHAAIASETKLGALVDPGLGSWGFRVEENRAGTLSMVSMNQIVAEARRSNCVPFIVKIDIEGFEQELFSKNVEWVDEFPVLIIELHDWMLPKSNNSKNFLSVIGRLNRDFVYYGENIFSISNRLT